ncbi:hypothetical protein [Microbulbifer epialgicus]|uniref:Uncharacterized protein n=1 Tax=Microbulbifer epialgicus TaxID=393907 RepID=A0ABV4P6W4_9GAMM
MITITENTKCVKSETDLNSFTQRIIKMKVEAALGLSWMSISAMQSMMPMDEALAAVTLVQVPSALRSGTEKLRSTLPD